MKNPTKALMAAFAVALVACSVFTESVQAIPISGSVDMSGTVFLNNASLGSATGATSFSGVTVGGIPTGSFVGTAGDAVTWKPFTWNPSSTPVVPLWTFMDAGTGYTYSFNLNSLSVISQSNTFLNLSGSGSLFITGAGSPYDVGGTPGLWSFTISNAGGGDHANFAFTFANSNTSVPEGGSALALLGAGLVILEVLRRKLATA